MLSLLNHYGLSGINEHMTACLIYSASLAVFNVLVFLLARIYRMLTKDFGLFESVTIFSFSMGVQLTGLVVSVPISYLPDGFTYFWSWILTALTTSFLLVSARVFVRAIFLFTSIFKKVQTRFIFSR